MIKQVLLLNQYTLVYSRVKGEILTITASGIPIIFIVVAQPSRKCVCHNSFAEMRGPR